MSLILIGANNNRSINASPDGRLHVSSRSGARAYYNAREEGLAFSWTNATYNYTAGDTILGVYNTSATKKLRIHGVYLWGDAATLVKIHRPTAASVTMAGTAVEGVNLNGSFSTPAPATAKADETGNTLGEILLTVGIVASGASVFVGLDDIVTLGQNQMIGVDYVTVGTAASVTIVGYFEADES